MKQLGFMFCVFFGVLAMSACSEIDRSAGGETPEAIMQKIDEALKSEDASLMVSCFHEADQSKVAKVIEALFEARGAANVVTEKIDEAKSATEASEIKFALMEELGVMFSPAGPFSRAAIKQEKTTADATVIGLREPLGLVKVGERWGLDADTIMHGQTEELHLRISKALKTSLENVAEADFAKMSSEAIIVKLREISNKEMRWVFEELDKAS